MIAGWSFARMSRVLPVKRLYETQRVLAFYHPRPSYPVHVLIVPKQAIKSFLDLGGPDRVVMEDVVKVAQQLVRELKLEEQGYRLIVNGGPYQDVGQLHFHLVSGSR